MKKLSSSILLILFSIMVLNAQVAVNTDGSTPDNSAMLDVQSTTKGMLIPRMTEVQRDAISSPATGLTVFVTDDSTFYFYNGSGWEETRKWMLSNNRLFTDTTRSVGVGTANPQAKFQVATIYHSGTYGSDECTGGTSGASEYYGPGYESDKAFDNSTTTYWSNNNSLPAWLQYDLGVGNKKRVAKYRLYFANATSDYSHSPDSWTFEASNDGTVWTALDVQTGEGWTTDEWKEYPVSNTTLYRYYRIDITDNKGTSNDFTGIYEVEMMEETLSNHNTLFVNDNKVGIGTASPVKSLDVHGTFKLSDGTEAAGKILSSDANGNAGWVDGTTVNGGGWTVNGNYIYNTGDSVGIGSSSPSAPLDVHGRIAQSGTGYSVFIGAGAGQNDDLSFNHNVFVGNVSGYNNTNGEYNTSVGDNSMHSNTTGNNNTAIGDFTLNDNTTGHDNSAFGHNALYNNTTGFSNVAIGVSSLYYNTDRSNLVAIGDSALFNNGVGVYYSFHAIKNTAVGSKALYSNTTGYKNNAVGYQALYSNTTGYHNNTVGYQALYSNTTGYQNNTLGYQALYSNTTGYHNNAVGYQVLYSNTTGHDNTANGYGAMAYNTTGVSNTANGYEALYSNTYGNNNTALGDSALYYNETGYDNTAIGHNAFVNGTDYHNSTALGNETVITGSNQIRFGNSDVTSIGGYANWSNVSDKRFKKDVSANVPGLDFILKLRPVTYHLDMDAIARFNHTPDSLRLIDDEKIKGAMLQTGFIAQEVEHAALSVGYDFSGIDAPKNENDYYGLRYAEFVVPLVKAVQELNLQNKNQQQTIRQQRQTIEKHEEMLAKQQHSINELLKRLKYLEKEINQR